MKKSKAAKPAKTSKRGVSKATTRDLPTLAASTRIRGGKLAANHVELALLR